MPGVLQQALLSSTSGIVLLPVTYSYLGHKANTAGSASSYAIPAVAVGAEVGGKATFLVVRWMGSALTVLTGVTIGGVTADIHAQFSNTLGSTYYLGVAVVSAVLPVGTGTSLSVVTAFSGNTTYVYVESYSVFNLTSLTPIEIFADNSTTAATASGTVDVQKEGFMLYGGISYAANTGTNLAGMTETQETSLGGNFRGFDGVFVPSADEVDHSFSATRTGGSGTAMSISYVAASFR